jgi:hypothetical protein
MIATTTTFTTITNFPLLSSVIHTSFPHHPHHHLRHTPVVVVVEIVLLLPILKIQQLINNNNRMNPTAMSVVENNDPCNSNKEESDSIK